MHSAAFGIRNGMAYVASTAQGKVGAHGNDSIGNRSGNGISPGIILTLT
jgi:anthranilate phosphoribosyltransferase